VAQSDMTQALWLWLVLALLVFWAVGAYNRLMRLRAQVLISFQPVDRYYCRMVALVDETMPDLATEASVQQHTVLRGAGLQFDSSLRVARRDVLDPAALAALRTAHTTLQFCWTRLLETCQQPGVPLDPPWLEDWVDNRRQAADSVAQFNQTVQAHNAGVGQFPALLLARVFGFRPVGHL